MGLIPRLTEHYAKAEAEQFTTACGIVLPTGGANISPMDVNCIKCKETELYKQDLISFEIGFDGDKRTWVSAWWTKRETYTKNLKLSNNNEGK